MKSHNSYEYGRKEFHAGEDDNGAIALSLLAVVGVCLCLYIAVHRFHIRPEQLVEAGVYAICFAGTLVAVIWHLLTRKRRREEAWPRPAIRISARRHARNIRRANEQKATLLAYKHDLTPWLWPDEIRRMQSLLLGMSGAGKTTLLLNIIVQDLNRWFGSRRLPLIIFDGKADKSLLSLLLPQIAAAGRMHQLRILDLSRPDISVRYNPLNVDEEFYAEHVNFIFESFGIEEDFFKGRQKAYFSDLVRVLVCTGKKFNIYDVMVMAMDAAVLKEQIKIAEYRLQTLSGVSHQRILNFQMSARSLIESLEDRARVEKIQGLLDKLAQFLEDKLSVITGPYEDLLTLDQVFDEDLILYVPLNINLYGGAAKALGRILLHNLQTLIGKRYENLVRGQDERPLASVILDEFAAYAYPDFAQIIQTARGINVPLLFSLQSISQLDEVSPTFRDNVASAPNTIMCMRTRDKKTAEYFEEASGKVVRKRRSLTVQQTGIFEEKYEPIGFGSETEIKESRSQDEHIKNLPQGQLEILMTDNRQGTLHAQLIVRPQFLYRLPSHMPRIYPHIGSPYSRSRGANLRFKVQNANRSGSYKPGRGGKNPWA